METQDVQEIQIAIDEAREIVEKRDALIRLSKNKDFKKIIEDGYFGDESRRLVGLLADNAMQNKSNVFEALMGVSQLENYFALIVRDGNMMEQQIDDSVNVMNEIDKK